MRLTARCLDMLNLLAVARWLSTGQLHRRFFKNVTIDAARKRLRDLEQAKYIFRFRENQMAESLLTLGCEAKPVLEKNGGREISLARRPPKQLDHYLGVNDMRIAAEAVPELRYFFGYWELPALNWHHRLIPDAVMALGNQTFALEFDRGNESLRFFFKTKIPMYRVGLPGLPLSALL